MTAITLKNIPDELHRQIKRMQLDYEDHGIKKTIQEIYLELLQLAVELKTTKAEEK